MKTRQNLVLLIVLLLCAALIIIVERPFERTASQQTGAADRLFPGLTLDAAKELRISMSRAEAVVIRKEGDRWVVLLQGQTYPADSQLVHQALETITKLRAEKLASGKKEKHDLFQVTVENGIEVVVLDASDHEAAHLFIGSQGPDLYSTYVRKDGSDAVYCSDLFASGIFDQPAGAWRDTTLFAFDPKEVTEVQIEENNQALLLGKDTKGNWHIEEPVSSLAEPTLVNRLVAGLASLHASDYADGISAAESGTQAPHLRVSVTLRSGSRNVLSIGFRQDETPFYYAATTLTNHLYTLHESIVEQLSPTIHDLQKSDAPPESASPAGSEEMPASAPALPPR